MTIKYFTDCAIVPVWDPKKSDPVEKELSLEKSNEWISDRWYWCPQCEFAVCSEDLPEELEEVHVPLCPECDHPMEDFDWEGILEVLGDGEMSSSDDEDEESSDWMYPEGHDDGESIDTMFGDDD